MATSALVSRLTVGGRGRFVQARHYFDGDQHYNRNRASQILQPANLLPHGEGSAQKKDDAQLSKSTRLLLDNGFIRSLSPGIFSYLPLAVRSLDKLSQLLERNLKVIGGQKILLPTLTDASLWKKTSRFDPVKNELFTTRDRNENLLILSPTHEESIAKLLADIGPVSYKSLPIRLYQISPKFRDEMKPRFGLIRSKEFIMKDLYTFDTDITSAMETYEAVHKLYRRLFRELFGRFDTKSRFPGFLRRVVGSTGEIGGQRSHEYHVLTDIGQDKLLVCPNCERGNNIEVDPRTNLDECRDCQGESTLRPCKGIEVAHTFLLADRYTSALGTKYSGLDGKLHNIFMGCYGIGVSRLMAASLEALSTEKELRWPRSIVPFSVCVICPKPGSREAVALEDAYNLYDALNAKNGPFENDVILDERDKMTVGKKLRDAYKTGYTYVVLFGKECADKTRPQVELHCLGTGEPQVNNIPLAEIQNVLTYLHSTSQ